MRRLLVFIACSVLLGSGTVLGCQFPGEIQGDWATQAITEEVDPITTASLGPLGVTYSRVTISHNSMSGWGECVHRHKRLYVLAQGSGAGTPHCHRCFHLLVVSPNVVVVTSRRGGRCYPTVEEARKACPPVLNRQHHEYLKEEDDAMFTSRRHETQLSDAELKARLQTIWRDNEQQMLYKVKSSWGDDSIAEIECPISGVFTFTYERGKPRLGHDAFEPKSESEESVVLCPRPTSEMSNCPYGFGLNIHYRDCVHAQPEQLALQCLGGWRGAGGQLYMAVLDTSVKPGDFRPKYRCGMYREESNSGRIQLAFSSDSTCHNSLLAPTDGYERYLLTSVPAPPLPPAVQAHPPCRFPPSLQGHWSSVLLEHNTFVFKDLRNLKRNTALCVEDMGDGEKFLVFTRTHCGDSNYNCLWLKRRSANVLEFMLGLYPNTTIDSSLCDVGRFGDQTTWNTVAKSELETPTRCPILGSFVGELPSAPGFCALLRSHCHTPHAMTYVVTSCRNATEAYEQRDYRCIGQWTEGNKVYALTYRPDTHTHECFVGSETSDGRVFLREAGAVPGLCERGVQPQIMGMELRQKADCSSDPPPTPSSPPSPSPPRSPPQGPPSHPALPPWHREKQKATTKPWKPITAPPHRRTSGAVPGQPFRPPTLLWSVLASLAVIFFLY